jgi:hypothetical protein
VTTLAPQNVKDTATDFENIYGSAVFSGIVGDAAHRLNGGYHISIEDQPSDNYSVVRVDDAAPPGNWPRDLAAAIDMSMNSNDMVLASQRIVAVWSNPGDTRRKYFNCFNGWLGSGDATRWDFVTGGKSYASPDHKWHVHGEVRRRYVNDPMAHKAWVSMMRGESHDQWLASIGVAGKTVNQLAQEVLRGDWGNGQERRDRLTAAGYNYDAVQAEVNRILSGGSATPPPPPPPVVRDMYLTDPWMTGDDVRRLQQKLKTNYRSYAGGIDVDGIFGPQTDGVVREFQRRAGLVVDGIVGPKTRARLGL